MRQIWLTDDDQRARAPLPPGRGEPRRELRGAGALGRGLAAACSTSRRWICRRCEALKGHYAQLQQRRKLIATLEREIRATAETGTKIDLARQVAALWEEEEDYKGAAESFERILRWDPVNALALEGLVRIYKQAGEAGKAIGALEHAGALVDDIGQRIELLRRALALIPEEDRFARFFQLRRILFLARGNREVLEELKAEAEAADKEQAEILWPELAAVLVQLSCQEPSDWLRLELARELAWVYEKKLSSKVRGYLALQSVLISPEHSDKVLEEVTRLAQSTKRHEDLLSLLDCLTTPDFRPRRAQGRDLPAGRDLREGAQEPDPGLPRAAATAGPRPHRPGPPRGARAAGRGERPLARSSTRSSPSSGIAPRTQSARIC